MAQSPFGSFLGSNPLVVPADLSDNSSTQQAILGAKAVIGPREFRYVLAGGTSLVPGKLQQASAQIANHQNLTPTAVTLGSTATSLTVTLGATLASANQYAEGFAVITVTPGQGYIYQVSSNPAAAQSASLTLALVDSIQVSLTTSSRVDLIASPYSGVIVNPAAASSAPVGVAVTAITNAQYGWIQSRGPAVVLGDTAITVGTNLVASNAVAGAVEPLAGVQSSVGVAITDITDTEYGSVMLLLN